MVTAGGEVDFVARMMLESLKLRDRVKWYTSMLGKLSNVISIVTTLKTHKIYNYVIGVFIQGRKTRRWVVGWTLSDRRIGDVCMKISLHSLEKNPYISSFPIAFCREHTHDKICFYSILVVNHSQLYSDLIFPFRRYRQLNSPQILSKISRRYLFKQEIQLNKSCSTFH